MDSFTDEDVKAALRAIERWGGVDTHYDSDGTIWLAPNAGKAMRHGLEAAMQSRARRESRAAMDALDLRVAAHLATRHS